MLYKRWALLTSDEVLAISIASRKELRFTSLWQPIFKDFGGPNGFANSIFQVFFDMIFRCVWASNFNRFLEAPNQKNSNFPCRKQWFLQNRVFDWNTQIARFCLRFRTSKRRKSIQNSNPKTYCFEASNLKGFFLEFYVHFGVQKSSTNRKFSKKLMFEGVLWSTIALELLFGWILSPLELDFKWFLNLRTCFFLNPASHLERHVWSVTGWRTCFDD